MRKKENQNRNFYATTSNFSKVAKRITIPMQYPEHVKTAQQVFKKLAESLEQILNMRSTGYRKVSLACYEIYEAHRALIETADESYNNKYKNGPKVDYKNAR